MSTTEDAEHARKNAQAAERLAAHLNGRGEGSRAGGVARQRQDDPAALSTAFQAQRAAHADERMSA